MKTLKIAIFIAIICCCDSQRRGSRKRPDGNLGISRKRPDKNLGINRQRPDENSEVSRKQKDENLEISRQRANENLEILLNLDLSFKDADWYLKKFEELQNSSAENVDPNTANEINELAQEMGWNSLLQEGAIDDTLQEEANTKGKERVEEMRELYEEVVEEGIMLGREDPGAKINHPFSKMDPNAARNSRVGFYMEAATEFIMESKNLPPTSATGLKLLGDFEPCTSNYGEQLEASFPKVLETETDSSASVCDSLTPYRSKDGSCNNLKEPSKGAGFGMYRRILSPDYRDGVSKIRRDVRGEPLPSAREVSIAVNKKNNSEARILTNLHMTFGQFLAHDLTRTPVIKAEVDNNSPSQSNTNVKCCDPKLQDITSDPDILGCATVSIPEDDPFYSKHGKTCLEFMRSSPAPKCDLGAREQTNEQSSYLDGSAIYGVKTYEQGEDPLRVYTDGLLKVSGEEGAPELLPVSKKENDGCNKPEKISKGEFCFVSGDIRVNDIPTLTFLHTVWAREHNRVAKILKSLLSEDASDEELYQEARRIVISELQHTVYNEYLPATIPRSLLEKNGLLPKRGSKQTNTYDDNEDATIANSFAAAAFRFGHSQIGDFIKTVNEHGRSKKRELSSLFFNLSIIYEEDTLGDLTRGSDSIKSADIDPYYSEEVSGKLLRGNGTIGLDLLAINIQRGRDHGIPGYTKWLAKCGGPEVNSFEDLEAVMTKKNLKPLENVYNDVHDIDLYAGGMSESPMGGGALGFTFTCLNTEQFRRIKVGDRFWYEEKGQAGSFTPAQIRQLHRVSLARIFCNNVPGLSEIQVFPLKYPGEENPIESCSSVDSLIPDYNFKPWKV